MKLTDKRIVKALEQGKMIGRYELYETICFYKAEGGALVMKQAGSQNKAIPYIIVADLKANDWEIVEDEREIIQALKVGKKIRLSWWAEGYYVQAFYLTHELKIYEADGKMNKGIGLTIDDIEDNEWEVVDE